MKITKMILVLALFCFEGSFAQSAFSDDGTVTKTDPRFTEVTVAGMIAGTGSLSVDDLDFINASGVVQFSYYLTASDDSVKVSVKLTGSDHAGKTADLVTLANADSTETY